MNFLPIFLDLKGRDTLVVGGGLPAAAKIRLLLKAGAAVRVVAPEVNDEILRLAEARKIDWRPRSFVADDTRNCAVVFGATDNDAEVAALVAATPATVPINMVDRPELSTFIMPAIVERDPIVIGISTGGASPALAQRLRARIESLLPARLGGLANFAAEFRRTARALLPDAPARRHFWGRFFNGVPAQAYLAGDEPTARTAALGLLNRKTADTPTGLVYMVGAGPGDPGLLTLQAAQAMERADVVLYDELIGSGILDRVRREAQRIYVGKSRGRHAASQTEINEWMLGYAKAGQTVVRLKGGDPFVFGRGGEEQDYLQRHGVIVVAVPGITAALGCAAAAGIPLTHRDHAAGLCIVSGHAPTEGVLADWAAFSRRGQTLAIYMGLANAAIIAAGLARHGVKPAIPVALIENGTRPEQRVIAGRLSDLGDLAAESGMNSPTLIVVGEVVRFAKAWEPAAVPAVVAW
jgi:uroporphyrin-III C-methyltransferase/precorrin-2 dehydrogenase/sirohydrochlorin ferrochelatase